MALADLTSITETLIRQESLPAAYADTVRKAILPLAQHIQALRQERKRPIIVGIHGAQGTGKSTLTLFLQRLLTDLYHVPTASFSIDDLYLTRAEREQLARHEHPLLLTRGVPGTHDLHLGQQVIDQLIAAGPGEKISIPAFDKARDDRAPDSAWPIYEGKAEVVLMEGWCVGALPDQSVETLNAPLNALESEEDPDGRWRIYVNQCLKGDYSTFFGQIDCLIMLKAPSMECVLEWRTLQEHKLKSKNDDAPKKSNEADDQSLRIMTNEEVVRFIMHYERITRASLAEMPARADAVINVDEAHHFSEPLIHQRQ